MPLLAHSVLIKALNQVPPSGAHSHGTLSVDTPGGQYAGAVDVATPSGIKVHYRLICRLICCLNHVALTSLLGLPAGWQPLDSTSSSGALDYVHSPTIGARPTSRYFDFLLFRRETLIGRFLHWLESLRNSLVDSSGDNALNALETQLLGSVRILVFGAPASSELSVHDIHLNQGDPLGPFQHPDGIWQDGGG